MRTSWEGLVMHTKPMFSTLPGAVFSFWQNSTGEQITKAIRSGWDQANAAGASSLSNGEEQVWL